MISSYFVKMPRIEIEIISSRLTESCIWGRVDFYSLGKLFCQDDRHH